MKRRLLFPIRGAHESRCRNDPDAGQVQSIGVPAGSDRRVAARAALIVPDHRRAEDFEIFGRQMKLRPIQLPLPRTDYAENIYWVYGIVLDDRVAFSVEELMTGLADRGVQTRPFFWPMHLQPVFCRMGMFPDVSCPVAEHLGRRGLYLPSGLTLSEDQIEYVSKMLRAVLN